MTSTLTERPSQSSPLVGSCTTSCDPDFTVVSEVPPDDPDDLWWADWDEVQRNRRAALHHACLRVKSTKVRTISKLLINRRYLYNLLVDDRHRTIYCYVPKVRFLLL